LRLGVLVRPLGGVQNAPRDVSGAETPSCNGDGLRTSHTSGGVTTNYTWDVASGLPVVLQDGTYTYVYGLDLISVTEEFPDKTTPPPAVQRYFFPDALGSTRALVNETDSGIETYGYDVFGQVREVEPAGAPLRSFLFTGEQYDAKARKQGLTGPFANPGFYYLRARFYDPTIGRFLTPDPLPGSAPIPQSLNRYPYVGNNPVNLTDPSGRVWETAGGCSASIHEAVSCFVGCFCDFGLGSIGNAIACGAVVAVVAYACGGCVAAYFTSGPAVAVPICLGCLSAASAVAELKVLPCLEQCGGGGST